MLNPSGLQRRVTKKSHKTETSRFSDSLLKKKKRGPKVEKKNQEVGFNQGLFKLNVEIAGGGRDADAKL